MDSVLIRIACKTLPYPGNCTSNMRNAAINERRAILVGTTTLYSCNVQKY